MIGRRLLLGGAVVCVARGAGVMSAVPEDGRLAFRVIRRDSAIGTHVLTFDRLDNGIDVHIAVDIAVGFGPLVLFRYTLRGVEQWRDGVVTHVEATTNDDGTDGRMCADRDARGLWVEGSKAPRYLAPANALPASHWNMAELDGPWINLQGGRLLRPAVRRAGVEQVKLADGRLTQATGFELSGDVQMELWYNAARRWSALLYTASDGSQVRYELI
jgi:Family of unknown function (DUF6134)